MKLDNTVFYCLGTINKLRHIYNEIVSFPKQDQSEERQACENVTTGQYVSAQKEIFNISVNISAMTKIKIFAES